MAVSMASTCSRIAQRTSLGSIKSAIKTNVATSSFSRPAFTKSTSTLRRSFLTDTNSIFPQLGCLQSMLPLHSAVASARLTSCLTTTSRSFRALSQELGLSVPR